jgi:Protein of unknown function (DUF642)
MRNCLVILALSAVLAMSQVARAGSVNIVQNGGFESGSFSGWTGNPQYSLVAGFTAGFDAPHSGTHYAMLGSYGTLGYLSQNLATTSGSQYDISFYLASDGAMPNQFTVSAGGDLLANLVNLPKSNYTEYNYTFDATSSSTTLTFGERDDFGYLLLDDVSVVDPPGGNPVPTGGRLPVPLPATVWLAGIPMLLMAGVGLNRRRAQA